MTFRDFWCVFRVPLRLMATDCMILCADALASDVGYNAAIPY
jgi:hypothetical protein